MSANFKPSRFWTNWLLTVAAGVVVFGLVLVFAPHISRQGFSLLVFASPDRIDGLGEQAVSYISLTHAVMGAVMAGWGSALFYLVRALFPAGSRIAWNAVALSVAVWFVPDTSYSLLSGYWQNAILNTVFLALFTLPLWALRAMRRNDA
jgi:hypothetical protein